MSEAFRCDRCDEFEDGNPANIQLLEMPADKTVAGKERHSLDVCKACNEDIQARFGVWVEDDAPAEDGGGGGGAFVVHRTSHEFGKREGGWLSGEMTLKLEGCGGAAFKDLREVSDRIETAARAEVLDADEWERQHPGGGLSDQ